MPLCSSQYDIDMGGLRRQEKSEGEKDGVQDAARDASERYKGYEWCRMRVIRMELGKKRW